MTGLGLIPSNYRWAKHPPAFRKPRWQTAGSQKLSAAEEDRQLAAEAGQTMMISKLGWIVYGDSTGNRLHEMTAQDKELKQRDEVNLESRKYGICHHTLACEATEVAFPLSRSILLVWRCQNSPVMAWPNLPPVHRTSLHGLVSGV